MSTRRYRGISKAVLLAATIACVACGGGGTGQSIDDGGSGNPGQVEVRLQRAYPNLTFDTPVAMVQAPGDGAHWYVVERLGVVKRFDADNNRTAMSTIAAAVTVDASGEGGLLGFALHPDFASNGQAFLSYTVTGPDANTPLVSRISRVTSTDGGRTFDPASEEILFNLDQPFTNHNGGHLAFGPDGHLYIAFGDGGGGGDPRNNAQNRDNLYGAVLRIVVDGGEPYGIPPDNPFADGNGAPEIYAYGLRNPWRFSFDRADGKLWLGDVGQGEREEIDIIERGGNYGWRCYEGSLVFDSTGCAARRKYSFQVAEYGHDEGQSVTGGFVYRGDAIPGLRGVYVFGDFVAGTVSGLFPEVGGGFARRVMASTDLGIVSFGEGANGELYVVDFFGGGLHRLVVDPP
ncbi:MAG: PQQ-dependent sugar dehydrogenase [Gammaproteobacteria bacterium]|nr:PQQ-dependent sugar dehydrogenase [Gammaproteobacteria bacterium]